MIKKLISAPHSFIVSCVFILFGLCAAGMLTVVVFYLFIRNFPVENKVNTATPLEQTETTESSPSSIVPQSVDATVSLLFVGDTMLARTIGDDILKGISIFSEVKPVFAAHDLVIANLETSVGNPETGTRQAGKLFTFQAPPEVVSAMKQAGIDAVTLANNHSMDFGPAGLMYTLDRLSMNGIAYFGAGNNSDEAFSPLILTVKKTHVALIAVNNIETYYTAAQTDRPGSAYFDREQIKNSIAQAKAQADVVIVMPHWGTEYQLQYGQNQQEWGHFFIDSGADLVVGTHPHVIQESEKYQDKMIYYSLGNFVFDRMPQVESADKGNMLEVVLDNGAITKTKLIPMHLTVDGYPAWDE